MISDKIVTIVSHNTPCLYPQNAPFLPHEDYPELKSRVRVAEEHNVTYKLFREVLRDLGWIVRNSEDRTGIPLGN